MPDIYVNLDGLIPREDFEAKPDQVSGANFAATQTITELEIGKLSLRNRTFSARPQTGRLKPSRSL